MCKRRWYPPVSNNFAFPESITLKVLSMVCETLLYCDTHCPLYTNFDILQVCLFYVKVSNASDPIPVRVWESVADPGYDLAGGVTLST